MNQDNQVIITNLDDLLTEQILYKTFTQYGQISSVKIMRHLITKQPRGFGFVNFMNSQCARKAIEKQHLKVILKNKVHVYPKRITGTLSKDANLFISNLPKTASRE